MKIYISALALLFCGVSWGQSLGTERIEKIKKSVVRITIGGSDAAGTGFVISNSDKSILILTCWHVIETSLIQDKYANLFENKEIFAEFINGEKIKTRISRQTLTEGKKSAMGYDYCILLLSAKPKQEISEFKLGDFSKVQEGDEVYTCGYPLGIKQQFISKGIVSTKYIDSSNQFNYLDGRKEKIYRKVALLDMTMNRGNSGGPIIKLGATPKDDIVIGIADFIISSGGDALSGLEENLAKMSEFNMKMDDSTKLLSLNRTLQVLTSSARNNTNGVSGCISLDHFIDYIKSP